MSLFRAVFPNDAIDSEIPARQNFAANVASAQLNKSLVGVDGAPTDTARALERLDAAFVVCFAAELAVNAYAHWLRPFLRSGWVQASLAPITPGSNGCPLFLLLSP